MTALQATAELNDLIRALARTFERAQQRFAARQEQLLDSLRSGAGGLVPTLRIQLPGGKVEELSPFDLCAPRRNYIQDMVVDLTCQVEELATAHGARLGLRMLPRAARQAGVYPLQLSFGHSAPILAELRFANQVVRRLSLQECELPSAKASAQAAQAQVYLLDPADAATVRISAAVIHPVPPPPTEPAGAAPAVAPATATASHLPPAESPAVRPTPGPLPQPGTRRWRLLFGLSFLLALLLIAAATKLASWRVRRPGPMSPPSRVLPLPVAPVPVRRPPESPASATPVGDAATARVAAAPQAADAPLKIRFYYVQADGVTGLTCNGTQVQLERQKRSRRFVGQVQLAHGAVCKATGVDKVRVYPYEALAKVRADAAGERLLHVRFRQR